MRQAVTDYKFHNSDITVPKGQKVFIPAYAIQRDPQIYPEPDTFDPERFSEENIKQRHPSYYLPFGDGPRNCIGVFLLNMFLLIFKSFTNNFDLVHIQFHISFYASNYLIVFSVVNKLTICIVGIANIIRTNLKFQVTDIKKLCNIKIEIHHYFLGRYLFIIQLFIYNNLFEYFL